MPSRSLRYLLALCIATLFTLTLAQAQDHNSLAGRWNMTSETDTDPVSWILVLKDTDGKLTAVLESEEGELAPKEMTDEGGVIKFRAPYQGEDYDIELKLVGDRLDGTWSGGGNSGKTHGTKPS
jgi:hypothetical protein